MEIMAREKCGLLAFPPTVPGSRDVLPVHCAFHLSIYNRLKLVHTETANVKFLKH